MSTKTKNVLEAWEKFKLEIPISFDASLHIWEETYQDGKNTITFYFEIPSNTPIDYVRTVNE